MKEANLKLATKWQSFRKAGQVVKDKTAGAWMDILVDLSQKHALQSVELSRHLLGEVLQVCRLYHLQTLKEREVNTGLTSN